MRRVRAILFSSAIALAYIPQAASAQGLIVEGAPPIPEALASRVQAYERSSSASFRGWNAENQMIVSGSATASSQLQLLNAPLGQSVPITSESGRADVHASPAAGGLLISKDTDGDEFYQLYFVQDGKATLLTDGKSRNIFGAWSKDGQLIGYTSTRRNGVDTDIYVVDPHNPASNRLVAQMSSAAFLFGGFSPDGRQAVLTESRAYTDAPLWLLDIDSGKLTQLSDPKVRASYGGLAVIDYEDMVDFAPNGDLWVISNVGSGWRTLGVFDRAKNKFDRRIPEAKGDVQRFAIAPDGTFIAYILNEGNSDRIKLLDIVSGAVRTVKSLDGGVAGRIAIAKNGLVGVSYQSPQTPEAASAIDPKTLIVTRWVGPQRNPSLSKPETVTVTSFDGEKLEGLLYRPDPSKFPGPRPLILEFHGGPEDQSRPGFLGRDRYTLDEQGIAILFPNVRGSIGYGGRFADLDNGPWRREDAVKDVGAFLEKMKSDPKINASRIAVSGGSYGGYMCYASAIRYGDKLKAAHCNWGVANFVNFLENTYGYRRDQRRAEYGDERDPKQREKLAEISPRRRASELSIPLMASHGMKDPRVPISESESFVKAVRDKGGIVWYLKAPDEGHTFRKPGNTQQEFLTKTLFWDQFLLK